MSTRARALRTYCAGALILLPLVQSGTASPALAAPSATSTKATRRSQPPKATAKPAAKNTAKGAGVAAVKCGPALATPPAVALPEVFFADDDLEQQWAWRAKTTLRSGGVVRLLAGHVDEANFSEILLQPHPAGGTLATYRKVANGKNVVMRRAKLAALNDTELTLQNLNGGGSGLALLLGGEVAWTLPGVREGRLASGARNAVTDQARMQPMESVVFRDDFMRAEGPDQKENPGDWVVLTGAWKTSGALRPRADNALNPNPFVFRATAKDNAKDVHAQTGRWFWADYAVTVAVRPTLEQTDQPLTVGLEAFRQADGTSVVGEIDFRSGEAVLRQGKTELARVRGISAEANQWHRMRLEPGPGKARLLLNGVEVASGVTSLGQGPAGLLAKVGADNYADFDDVRIGAVNQDNNWGEPPLPDRFVKDRLMQFWASNARAWKRDRVGTLWHTGDFFRDGSVEFPAPDLKPGSGLQLVLQGVPGKENTGTRVEISRPGEKKELVYKVVGSTAPEASGTVPIPDLPMVIKAVRTAGARGAQLRLAVGDKFVQVPVANTLTGTKIGVRPLMDGKPLPPTEYRPVKLTSGTFEREGRAVIGINITPVTAENAPELGLTETKGAIVDAVEPDSPAEKAGVLVGDVIRMVQDKPITTVESLIEAVGARQPGTEVALTVMRPQGDKSGLDWEKMEVSTPNVLDYSFTMAPTDWHATKGKWEIAERWTCSPQWSFFAGESDANPTLWSRFKTEGDYTLEAYIATPMDLARGERSPMDLNVSVGGDGHDLASGYSFQFAARQRSANIVRRGDTVVQETPFKVLPLAGDTHQDWFYVRIERRKTAEGLRLRYIVNGELIADYLDKKPLSDGGRLAFWTVNGGLSIARVRLWHSGVTTAPLAQTAELKPTQPLANPLGVWTVRSERNRPVALVRPLVASIANAPAAPAKAQGAKTVAAAGATVSPVALNREGSLKSEGGVEIVNRQSGGDWTVYATRNAFDAKDRPTLTFDYKLGPGVKINLYARVQGIWREIAFTAPRPTGSDAITLGGIDNVVTDNQWHRAQFNLLSALREKGLPTNVEALCFAAPATDYLRAGLGGNHLGATYAIRNFDAPTATPLATATGG